MPVAGRLGGNVGGKGHPLWLEPHRRPRKLLPTLRELTLKSPTQLAQLMHCLLWRTRFKRDRNRHKRSRAYGHVCA